MQCAFETLLCLRQSSHSNQSWPTRFWREAGWSSGCKLKKFPPTSPTNSSPTTRSFQERMWVANSHLLGVFKLKDTKPFSSNVAFKNNIFPQWFTCFSAAKQDGPWCLHRHHRVHPGPFHWGEWRNIHLPDHWWRRQRPELPGADWRW